MKRASVTITDDLEKVLEAYGRDQNIPPKLVDVMQADLRRYLAERGYSQAPPTRVRRKPKGVPGDQAVSIEGQDNLGAVVIDDRR